MVFLLSLLICAFASPAHAAPAKAPSDAEALTQLKRALEALPGRALTLDFVLEKAMQESSSYRALEAGLLQAEATALLGEGGYDWTLFGGYSLLDSEADVTSAFNPTGNESRGWTVGARKRFSTGTSFQAEYGNTFNNISFANPAFRVPDYYENKLSFSLQQDLWANFLGRASRAALLSSRRQSEAERLGYELARERWALDIIGQFYAAWAAQKKLQLAAENRERRKELLEVTRLKSRRGTAERPDVLQVEAALLLAESAEERAEAELGHIWRNLVVLLKLPDSWLAVPPAKVPMEIGPVPAQAAEVCARETAAEATLAVRRTQLLLEAAEQSVASAASERAPKLLLGGAYEVNGIDGANSASRRETLERRHPLWRASLSLELPLGMSAQEGKLGAARAALARARGEHEASRDSALVNLGQGCAYLEQEREALAASVKAAEKQRERIRLEERRFSLGRATTFQVIQAGDDLANTQQVRNQNEAALRQRAWSVIQTASALGPVLSPMLGRGEK